MKAVKGLHPMKHTHRIIEWPELKRTTMLIQFQPPCCVHVDQPPDQAAQSHIQPGLECLQGWGIHSLLGQPVQCITTVWVKNFLLIPNLSLPCLSLKPLGLGSIGHLNTDVTTSTSTDPLKSVILLFKAVHVF